ncbi:MAG TPA: riboflavin synthase [Syntrophales bacterium]|nr:riboflavin synthase [Syntrophales bacterium]HOX94400.1 riboflavin synthase [Syntrophales bacterium]HPI58038.1 riboflavin synthase [Syntrophales bacterium]HPN25254.1 riboflavin synthase [Syntrophales bacterium]HQM29327.1 riboflavin synthase [Syntrophales bacterium]
MFTGIIQGLGTVRRMTRKGQDAVMGVETAVPLNDLKEGDSIAVNGACLTITSISGQAFTADVSAETLARTNLQSLKVGERVNLEKALRLADFLGGHIVLGHIDGPGRIVERTPKAGSIVLGVVVEEGLGRYIVEKGSIAVDGISLTVNRFAKDRFYVNIIPHTIENTTLSFKRAGDSVNIETDILGKYVEKLLRPGGRIDMDFLREHGFVK